MMCDPSRDPGLPATPGTGEPNGQVARSGAGADTAMLAMLKKRKMRVRRDADVQLSSSGTCGEESPDR